MSNIENLKKQADQLGIKYSPNIGEETLQERVNSFLVAKAAEPKKTNAVSSLKETAEERRARKKKEANALVRVKVSCFDPAMKKRSGTYIMASNSLVGTVRKFIQFNKPWMMPRILVNAMKESMYQAWIDGETQFGITKKISSLEPRYSVVEMPPLTQREIDDIAKRQAVTESLN